MGKPFCKMVCLYSYLIILGNKRWCPVASALGWWSKFRKTFTFHALWLQCWVHRDCREDSQEKDSIVLLGGYPGETSFSLIITSSHFPFTLSGECMLQSRIYHDCWQQWVVVLLSSLAQNAGLLGHFLWLCWKSTTLYKPHLQGGNLAQLPCFNIGKGGYKGYYCFLWSISLHGCYLSRATKGSSCSQVRQQVLNPNWGNCYGFALLSLLLILQLFWGFVNPVTRFTAWRISTVFCNRKAFM